MKVLFCFSKNKFPFNVVALLIRAFQPKSRCSHVAVLDEDINMVFDMSFGGFRCFTIEEFNKLYTTHHEAYFEVKNVLQYARVYSHHKYGFLQLIGNLMDIVFSSVNPFKNGTKKLICNEFAMQLMLDMKMTKAKELGNIEDVTIDELLTFLKE